MNKRFDVSALSGSVELGKDGPILSNGGGTQLRVNSSVGVLNYMGGWDASTNTPTLADSTGIPGYVYRVDVGGTVDLGSGSIVFTAQDWVYRGGAIYRKIATGGDITHTPWMVVTSNVTAANGDKFLANTTSGAFTVTLPGAPAINDVVKIAPMYPTYSTNAVTVGRNSQLIAGAANDVTLDQNGASVEFVFVGGSEGWAVLDRGDTTVIQSTSFDWQGTWVSQDYIANQAVSYNGSSYICILDTTSSQVPTNGTYWEIVASKGDNGYTGSDGNTVLYGSVAPTTEGVNGNFYINTTNNYIYGPKASGTWPSGTSLIGPAGAAGNTGPAGEPNGPQSYTSLSSSGGVVTIDCSSSTKLYNLTLTENVTSWVFTNLPSSGTAIDIYVTITQHASSAKTCVTPVSSGNTAGGLWILSTALGSKETLGFHFEGSSTVYLYPSGPFA